MRQTDCSASTTRTSTKNRYARADTAVRPYTEDLFHVSATWFCKQIWQIYQIQQEPTSQRDVRWNVEWVGRKPDIQHFVGCKPVQTRRLPGRAPSTMAISKSDDHLHTIRHRGWSTHIASRRYRLAQPNRTLCRSFVTPGGIGTHRMHPPRKRTHRDSNIASGNHQQFDTRGPTQRPAQRRPCPVGWQTHSHLRVAHSRH